MLPAHRQPRRRLPRPAAATLIGMLVAGSLALVAQGASSASPAVRPPAPKARRAATAYAGEAPLARYDEVGIKRTLIRLAGTEAKLSQDQAAIAAAKSQLGVPYHYAMSSPGVGFDCSGLVMYAWGRAGVALPHNSGAMYSVLPHISSDELRPGDLLFFYSPIHHVAIYLGNGRMIHASQTGEPVKTEAVYWQYFTGAARPN